LALAGLVTAVRGEFRRTAALLAAMIVALAIVYVHKNAGSERYLAQLVPLLAIMAGFALAAVSVRIAVIAAVPVLGALLLLTTRQPPLGTDPFPVVASRVSDTGHLAVITAAPTAYGYLLPDRSVRRMRAGQRGLVIVDGASRAFEPRLAATGTVVGRIKLPDGFVDPSGRIDHAPALLVRGVVTTKTG
jgi:hypothetical protein